MLRPGCELTGGLASHCVLVTGTAIFRVPADLPDAAACPANCAGATVAAAIERAGPLAGKSVLVIGCGMLGVTTTAWARELGAEHVIVCDVMPDRLGLSTRWGATDTPSPAEVASLVIDRTGGHGVDVVFEMTGSPEAFATALSVPRMGGSVSAREWAAGEAEIARTVDQLRAMLGGPRPARAACQRNHVTSQLKRWL
jgi:threonine dehydrogenase-like Zn-dependent dehydrogenase